MIIALPDETRIKLFFHQHAHPAFFTVLSRKKRLFAIFQQLYIQDNVESLTIHFHEYLSDIRGKPYAALGCRGL
jgi:hypothetical protein